MLVGLTCFLQVVAAAGIITVTAWKLHKVTIDINTSQFTGSVNNVCLLGSTDNGANLCYFAYGASGVSIIATGILSLLQCCTCNLCGLGGILDALFAAAGTVLWAIAGVVFRYYGQRPGMQLVPRPEWRASIPILAFVACGLFGVMCLAAIWGVFSACCCGGSRSRGGGRRGPAGFARDVEAPAKATGYGGPPPGYPPQGQFVVGDANYARRY